MKALEIINLSKRWPDGQIALQNVTLTAKPGSLTVLVGPSGCGKTTLLRILAGLEKADSGQIEREPGQPAMVFQEDSLWPHMTLLENVAAPLRVVQNESRSRAIVRATEILKLLGLENRMYAYPHRLSGGQRQRGALARALLCAPHLLCLDEVTSGLDPETTAQILYSICELKNNSSIVIMATHQLNFARWNADWVVFLEAGGIVEQGPPDQTLSRPRTSRVRQYIQAWDQSPAVPSDGRP